MVLETCQRGSCRRGLSLPAIHLARLCLGEWPEDGVDCDHPTSRVREKGLGGRLGGRRGQQMAPAAAAIGRRYEHLISGRTPKRRKRVASRRPGRRRGEK